MSGAPTCGPGVRTPAISRGPGLNAFTNSISLLPLWVRRIAAFSLIPDLGAGTVAVAAGASSLGESGSKLPHSKITRHEGGPSLLSPIARRFRPYLPAVRRARSRPPGLLPATAAPGGTVAARWLARPVLPERVRYHHLRCG